MAIGLLTLQLRIPMCSSLKETRSQLKPLIARQGREINVSVAELDLLDNHNEAVIGCVHLSNDANHTHRCLQKVISWVESHYPDLYLVQERIELL